MDDNGEHTTFVRSILLDVKLFSVNLYFDKYIICVCCERQHGADQVS